MRLVAWCHPRPPDPDKTRVYPAGPVPASRLVIRTHYLDGGRQLCPGAKSQVDPAATRPI